MPYKTFQIQNSSTAFLSPYGQSWSRAYGCVKDYLLQTAKQAVKLRFPDVGYSSPDAIGAIGDERLVDALGAYNSTTQTFTESTTGATETLGAYANRVRNAWGSDDVSGQAPEKGIWYWGGTAYGMLTALAVQGYTGAHIIQQNGIDWSLDGSGDIVVTPRLPTSWTLWNSFAVLFPSPPSGWTNMLAPVGGVVPSGGLPNQNEYEKLVRIINLWRPAQALCLGIIAIVSGRVWGFPSSMGGGGSPSPGEWGYGTWGGVTVVYPVPVSPVL